MPAPTPPASPNRLLLLMWTVGLFTGLSMYAGLIPLPYLQWQAFCLCMFGTAALGAAAGALVRGRQVPAVFLAAALLAGLVARIGFLPQVPSNDVHRYLWEGRVQLAGVNPYAVPPADPSLAHLRGATFREINHPEWTAIYGPLAEGLFAALAWLAPTVVAWKLLLLAVDGLLLFLLWRLLVRIGRSPWWLIGYAWHPLAIWSNAGEAHLESVMVAALLAALLALLADRDLAGGLLLGCAVLVKPTAALFAPLLLIPRLRGRGLAAFALTLLAGYLPYASAGRGLLDSLLRFGARMRFNSLPDALLGGLFPVVIIRALSLAALAGLLVWLRRRQAGPIPVARWLAIAWLLLAPTVHPWYGLALIPLLCLEGAWFWWVLTVSLICAGQARALELLTGRWQEPFWLPAAVYGTFGLSLAVELVRQEVDSPRRRAERETSP